MCIQITKVGNLTFFLSNGVVECPDPLFQHEHFSAQSRFSFFMRRRCQSILRKYVCMYTLMSGGPIYGCMYVIYACVCIYIVCMNDLKTGTIVR